MNFMRKKWLRTEYFTFDPLIVVTKKFKSRDLAALKNSQEFCGRECQKQARNLYLMAGSTISEAYLN